MRRSTNGGTTWLTAQGIATSVECVDPGPLPSVAGYSDGSAFIAYCDQTDEKIRCKKSTDAGASWSTISATPQTNLGSHMPSCGIYTTPSSTIQANLVHANGEPAANCVYYNYYDFSTSAWGTATNLSSILPGQYSDFTDPSIGQSTNFRTLHIAWDAFDENSENRVIVYREGGFRSFVSEYSVLQHEGALKPSITGTFDEEAWVVYQDESGIWKRWYDGSYWDYESYVEEGFDAQTSVGSASARYLWTSGSASPYQVNLSTETLSKPGAGPTYSRALNLIDTARGSSITIELGRTELVRKDGTREPIMFARSPGDTLQLGVSTLCDAGSTVAFVFPEDADSLRIEYSVYGARAKELFVEEAGTVSLNILNASTGATIARVGIQTSAEITATKPAWVRTSLPVNQGLVPGVSVRIRPVITGVKDLPLLASLGHIYGRSEGGVLQKVRSQRQIPVSAMEVPGKFELEQSYPNPFNPSTTIRYRLAAPGLVRLSLFDVLGREVAVLVDERHEAGIHTARWVAVGVSSGMYMARLTVTGAAGETMYAGTQKLLLAK